MSLVRGGYPSRRDHTTEYKQRDPGQPKNLSVAVLQLEWRIRRAIDSYEGGRQDKDSEATTFGRSVTSASSYRSLRLAPLASDHRLAPSSHPPLRTARHPCPQRSYVFATASPFARSRNTPVVVSLCLTWLCTPTHTYASTRTLCLLRCVCRVYMLAIDSKDFQYPQHIVHPAQTQRRGPLRAPGS